LEPRRRDQHYNRLSPTETGKAVTRAIVITPFRRGASARTVDVRLDSALREPEARLEEAVGLARAIDLEVVHSGLVPLTEIRPATYLGKGKVDEIAGLVKTFTVELVVMDCAVSPGQQRNLEKAWNAKVLDRTGLILEIFGRRARTREGSLQVELAHLNYQKSRLVRSWTHLERQRGGFGFLGGPGETQLEADRRVIAERIARIERDLEGVKRTRKLHRASRKRVPYPIVALVGYTNAGKSTLFNRITRAEVLSADMLFATLDPTLRAVDLPHGTRVILSDTVGFISDLPTTLVAAFRATLEEVIEADVILHARDIAHGDSDAQARDVGEVLRQLDIDPNEGRRLIEVWNKVDLLAPDRRIQLVNRAERMAAEQRPVLVSAVTGEGLDRLQAAIETRLVADRSTFRLMLDPADGEGASWLHRHTEVLARSVQEDGRLSMTVRTDPSKADLVRRKFGRNIDTVRRGAGFGAAAGR
jgi:GTP-binding protein HflX